MDGGEGRAALVLTGGGARAAYQVGVLNAIRELRGKRAGNPFPILCGTSAGAINAVALAVHAGDFGRAVRHIDRIWRGLHVHDVYRVDPPALFGSGVRWGCARSMRAPRKSPRRSTLANKRIWPLVRPRSP